MAEKKLVRILNLGAGVQSTTVYLLALEGKISSFDYAIFADTQEEPESVYQHLEWLQKLQGPPILIRSAGKLGDDIKKGSNSTGQRFVSIPIFTAPDHQTRKLLTGCERSQVRRQCTSEYKIKVVERTIRREILDIRPRQQISKHTKVVQIFGISRDERIRANRIRERIAQLSWSEAEFPLLDLGWIRAQCQTYLRDKVPHEVTRSACVFCPYKSDREWLELKEQNPQGWQRAVEIDQALRIEGNVMNRNLHQSFYLHSQCIPLEMVEFQDKDQDGFFKFHCDEGMCGV